MSDLSDISMLNMYHIRVLLPRFSFLGLADIRTLRPILLWRPQTLSYITKSHFSNFGDVPEAIQFLRFHCTVAINETWSRLRLHRSERRYGMVRMEVALGPSECKVSITSSAMIRTGHEELAASNKM